MRFRLLSLNKTFVSTVRKTPTEAGEEDGIDDSDKKEEEEEEEEEGKEDMNERKDCTDACTSTSIEAMAMEFTNHFQWMGLRCEKINLPTQVGHSNWFTWREGIQEPTLEWVFTSLLHWSFTGPSQPLLFVLIRTVTSHQPQSKRNSFLVCHVRLSC